MMAFAGPISKFIDKNPSITILALAFLITIGILLIGEGFGEKIDKGYIYFAMLFSLFIESLNIRANAKNKLEQQ